VSTRVAVGEWSKERSAELLGPDLMAEIARQVAAAPPPSPDLIAQLRRAFAVAGPQAA
jgi:hypothetical protein